MIRFLLLGLLFFVGYTVLSTVFRILGGFRREIPPEKSHQGEDMVRDPHCGTYVPRSDAVSKSVKGKKVYFCSTECRDAYKGE